MPYSVSPARTVALAVSGIAIGAGGGVAGFAGVGRGELRGGDVFVVACDVATG
jgi:hypothetical protein